MSRTRSSTTPYTPANVTMYGKRYSGQTSLSSYSQISASIGYNQGSQTTASITDVVSPEYRKRSGQGEIINNPLTQSKITLVDPQPTPYLRKMINVSAGKYYGDHWEGTWPMSPLELGEFLIPSWDQEWLDSVTTLRNIAVTEAHARVTANETQVLVSAAELNKTIEGLGVILRKVSHIILAARKADFKYLARQISWKELSNTWMEARYGLRPLYYEARATLAALNRPPKQKRQTFRATRSGTWSKRSTVSVTNSSAGYNASIEKTAEVQTSVSAGILTDVTLTGLNAWGGEQFASAAWELVPLSFVIDWFFNVGSTIAAWSPDCGTKQLASWVTTKHVAILTNSLVSITNTSSTTISTFSWSGVKSKREEWVLREPDPVLGVWPQRRLSLDTSKLLDIVIIGRQRMSTGV